MDHEDAEKRAKVAFTVRKAWQIVVTNDPDAFDAWYETLDKVTRGVAVGAMQSAVLFFRGGLDDILETEVAK